MIPLPRTRPLAARPSFPPGVCVPWAEKAAKLPEITGDAELVRRVREEVDSLGYTFIWQCLLSF